MVVVVFFALWPVPGQAQSDPEGTGPLVSLNGPVDSTELAPFIEYIIDPDWDMTVSALSNPDPGPAAGDWQALPEAGVDFGYTPARIWLRVAVVNQTAATGDWRFFVHANFFPTLQIWQVGEDGAPVALLDLGRDSPFSARPIADPQPVAPFALAPGQSATLIMAYSSQGSSRTAISIETAESYAALSSVAIAKTYTFYGMFLALLAVTSIALVVLRQVLHAAYAAYVGGLALYIAHIDGTTFQHIWPSHPGLNNMASVVLGTVVMVAAALFAIIYLQTRRHHPRMHRVLIGAIVTILATVSVLWVYDPQLLKQVMVVFLPLNALVIVTAAIVAAWTRFDEVKYFLFAWLAALSPAVLFMARHVFAFESGIIATYDAVRAALVFDAYMMGYASLDQLRRSRERALAESLAMARRNLMLGERLAVLDQSYETLSNQARLREEDVKDAVHDLRQPMHALRLSMRQRFVEGNTNKDSSQFEAALAYMEQLVADRLASTPEGVQADAPALLAEARQAKEPGLHEVLRGVTEMFAPEAKAKGLALTLRLGAADGPVEAYPLMRAMANLVSNAIKYTRKGRVLITLRRSGPGWRVEVHDTGPGLDKSQFSQALERNARLDRDRPEAEGSGLGLAIVQDIVTTQGWTMTHCNRRRTGASILLEVPATSIFTSHRIGT
ncbi:MAG: sensor histidine kinase [Rhodobacteraceae bacterium]|nr:sensor histidine kinase [Paracoccaceae bacterium]